MTNVLPMTDRVPQTTVTVTYTVQEIQALTQMLDMAAKSGGLSVVNVIAVLHQKHLAAVQAATDKANEPQEG